MTAVRAQIEGETKRSRKRPQRGSKKQSAQARESVTSETEQRATNQEQESKPEPAPGAAGEPTTGLRPCLQLNKYLVSSNECSTIMCNKAGSQLLRQQA